MAFDSFQIRFKKLQDQVREARGTLDELETRLVDAADDLGFRAGNFEVDELLEI